MFELIRESLKLFDRTMTKLIKAALAVFLWLATVLFLLFKWNAR